METIITELLETGETEKVRRLVAKHLEATRAAREAAQEVFQTTYNGRARREADAEYKTFAADLRAVLAEATGGEVFGCVEAAAENFLR